jgi:hypothetical protein
VRPAERRTTPWPGRSNEGPSDCTLSRRSARARSPHERALSRISPAPVVPAPSTSVPTSLRSRGGATPAPPSPRTSARVISEDSQHQLGPRRRRVETGSASAGGPLPRGGGRLRGEEPAVRRPNTPSRTKRGRSKLHHDSTQP